jgi:membrane associated rhomboid family serine protease
VVLPLHDDNPTSTRPYVTVAFIIACVLIFFWQVSAGPVGGQNIVYALGSIPAVLFGTRELPQELQLVPPAVSVLTSMFLHGGWLHLLGNMLYLWVFGNNVEDAMGHGRFIAFYVICGIAAALAQAVPDPTSTVPMVGASGAISGVLGAYMLLYPHARVLLGLPLGFFIVQLGRFPAVWVLAAWFAMQLAMNALTPSNPLEPVGGGVAFRAHIGGFLAGMILIPLFKRRNVRLWRARS